MFNKPSPVSRIEVVLCNDDLHLKRRDGLNDLSAAIEEIMVFGADRPWAQEGSNCDKATPKSPYKNLACQGNGDAESCDGEQGAEQDRRGRFFFINAIANGEHRRHGSGRKGAEQDHLATIHARDPQQHR